MTYLITFLEGIITFVSPCLLPMIPIYVTYFAAGKDGVNHFFKTYNEHLAFINSDMYQPD